MTFTRSIRSLRWLALGCCAAVASVGAIQGCAGGKKKPPVIQPRYTTLPTKNVPAVFKDTILERCDLINSEPYLISGYGLVVNLDHTGDTTAPNAVREYIYNLMVKHKWGSSLSGIALNSPDQALRDPRLAIVQVDGYLPPGARKGQRFDVQVSAIPDSNTTSLAGGDLLETELRIMGANPSDPGGAINVLARAGGPILVNPAYALKPKSAEDPGARHSLRFGVVMDKATSLQDRALGLRLRSPSMRLSRYIEERIDTRFQEIRPDTIAAAQDEAIVYLYVPYGYEGDWERFSGVVTHLYLNSSPEFSAAKAVQLADEAVKPDAPLMDISYAWEGLGKYALPVIQERGLMAHENADIAYAAARAAAFMGDASAPQVLVKMARTPGHKFQVNALHVLASLPSSPAINEMLRPLLDSDQTLVRLETYKLLARNADNAIFSTPVGAGFALDVVRSEGPPVIYATRRGAPRIGVLGNRTSIDLPVTFSAMDGRLTISSDASNKFVNIFYRPATPPGGVVSREAAEALAPIRVTSRPDIVEVVARLAGEGYEPHQRRLHFNYGQIVAILNNLTGQQQLSAMAGGAKRPASFILQELPQGADSIYSAPVIGDQGRPQTDATNATEAPRGEVGMAR